jgi:hypothetical protein
VKLSELKPDTHNANKGTPRGRRMVEQSLRTYGAGRSILIDRDGHIIAGNKTAEGAKAAGIKDVMVVKSDGSRLVAVQRTDLNIDDREARELAIADNRASEVSLEWDPNVLAGLEKDINLDNFWSSSELEKLLADVRGPKEAPEAKLDKAAELQQKYGTARGQIWEIGKHRLMCGDAFGDARAFMGDEMVDCVFTSPPYAVGIDYGTYQDTIENLRELLPKLSNLGMKYVRAGGYAVVNFGDVVSGGHIVGGEGPCEYPMALEHWPPFRADGWRLWARRIWCKPGAAVGSSRHCIGTNRAASNFEHIWTWKKDGKSIISEQTVGEYASQNGWFDSTHGVNLGVGLETHGAGMPVMPALFSISNHSRPGHVVLEPFCGTATTMVAAQQIDRICYGMEIEPKYVAVALQRMSDMGLKPRLAK